MKYQNLLLFDNSKKCWKPNFDFQKRLQNFQIGSRNYFVILLTESENFYYIIMNLYMK